MAASWLTRLCLFSCFFFSHCVARSLEARETSVVAPIQFSPDENWDGIDGRWSSFTLRVGTPAQIVRVFASWISYQTWVVHPDGCPNSTDSTCANGRGNIFYKNESSTWDDVGLYSLWIEENLGYEGNAYYGYDVVGLGGIGEGGPTLKNTTVGDLAVTDFYLGVFGLNPKPTNWTSYQDSSPSYMTQLKEQALIPSVSFGYTAGAIYRFTGVGASLILGGYDASRFVENNVEFTFAFDNERDTVVGVQAISTTSQTSSSPSQLLPTPIYALADATVPQIWLPVAACQIFEQEFGLIHDETTDLYIVNASLHSTLLTRNASITFTLGQSTSGGATVDIVLPYASFDLTASPPYQGLENSTTYFPLRRAANESQYTLGRTFFQEAYIGVDYERAKFNISQCTWEQNAAADIVTVLAAETTDSVNYSGNTTTASKHSSGLSVGAIVGIAIGAVAVIAIIAGILIWRWRRQKRSAAAAAAETKSDTASASGDSSAALAAPTGSSNVYPKAELEGNSAFADAKDTESSQASFLTPGTPSTPSTQRFSTFMSSNNGTQIMSPVLSSDGTHMTSPHVSSNGTHIMSPLSPRIMEASEADGLQIYEMPGDMPQTAQADGKEMSEKDMMKRREEQYNGVNRNHPANRDEEQVPRERKLVNAENVVPLGQVDSGDRSNKRFSFERPEE